ncbi:MAG TPA: GNAT family N-acyltransferase [Anaerolineales bacterium]|nr:GNAT family N-acyltransferase [Anaerolineales bacterium]
MVDDLSRGFIQSVNILRFDIAREPREREAVFRLRYHVVVERGWIQATDLADGMEQDHYDQKAVHILGWDGAKLATASRLVLPEPGLKLPTEEAFQIEVQPRGKVADMGRQIVAREYSSIKHKVFAALLAKTWLEMRAREYSLVCGDFSPAMTRLYRLMGFQVQQLGPAKPYWGEERAPVMVDVAGSAAALMERWGNQSTASAASI